MVETGSQPAIGPPPIVEPCFPIAGLSLAPRSPDCPPYSQRIPNLLPTMGQLSGPDHPIRFFLNNGDPGRLRAGVNLQAVLVNDRLFSCPIRKEDGERVCSMDDRPT